MPWATLSAFVAIMLNIHLVAMGSDENTADAVVLGLADVVASWVVMGYSFAPEYTRLDLRGGGSVGGTAARVRPVGREGIR